MTNEVNYKGLGRLVGFLFVFTMFAGMIDAYYASEVLQYSIEDIGQSNGLLILGAFCISLMALGIVGIAIALYPIVKKINEAIALTYFGFRVIECILLLIGAMVYIIILDSDNISAAFLSNLIVISNTGYQFAMLTLGLGSILLFYAFSKSTYLPKWLAIWGLIGYICLTISAVLDICNLIDTTNGMGIMLYIPGGVFELIIFPIWLFVWGFDIRDDNRDCVKKVRS